MIPIAIWEHPNGRRVEVYPDRRVMVGYILPDEFPVLYRTTVPHLSDEEWYSKPGDGDPHWRAA